MVGLILACCLLLLCPISSAQRFETLVAGGFRLDGSPLPGSQFIYRSKRETSDNSSMLSSTSPEGNSSTPWSTQLDGNSSTPSTFDVSSNSSSVATTSSFNDTTGNTTNQQANMTSFQTTSTPANNSWPSSANSTTVTPEFNMTTILPVDDRTYYVVEYAKNEAEARSHWIELDTKYTHEALNGRAQGLQLQIPWKFVFYGHDVDHITITTAGFLYMSDYLHQYLSATQYIAPLMADFNTESVHGNVYFHVSDSVFIAEWRNITLHSQPNVGSFSFQAQLYREKGKIVFAYKNIPIPVAEISRKSHSVKIGLADAYYYDRFWWRRIIYEYNNIAIEETKVTSDAAIIFIHQTTCNLLTDCQTCHTTNLISFDCFWCETLQRCSDSKDRGRQEWLRNSCRYGQSQKERCLLTSTQSSTAPTTQTTTPLNVSTTRSSTEYVPDLLNLTSAVIEHTDIPPASPSIALPPINASESQNVSDISTLSMPRTGQGTDSKPLCTTTTEATSSVQNRTPQPLAGQTEKVKGDIGSGAVAGIIIGVLLCLVLLAVVALYVYGFNNPHSAAGQFFIKYRPSKLRGLWHGGTGSRSDNYRFGTQVLSNDAYEDGF